MKLKLLLSSATIVAMPLFTLISCGNSSKVTQQQSTFVVSSQSTLDLKGYDLDYSVAQAITPKAQDYKATLGAGKMLRIETIGSAQYNDNGTQVLKSAYTKYKMDLISEIHLIDKNGNKTVFDTDVTDAPGAQTQEPYVMLMSSNEKSVNHLSFKSKLASAVKMTFKVKPQVYWINAKGEKTNFEVKAADFVYSYLRSYYNGFFQRIFGGGSGAADVEINKEFKLNNHFRGDRLFTKNQLFEVYGVSSPKFRDLSKSVNSDNTEVTFEQMEGTKADFQTFLDQMLVKSNIIAAAPSEYIKNEYNTKYKVDFDAFVIKTNAMTEEEVYNKYKAEMDKELSKTKNAPAKSKLVENKKKSLISQYKYGTDLVLQTGVYWYGLSGWDKNLYAGAYYPTEVKGNSLIFKFNPEFADRNWVNSTTKIQKFVVEHFDSNQDNFTKFKQGSLSEISFNQLNSAQKQDLLNLKDKYSFKYSKNLNALHSVNRTSILTNPAPLPSAQGGDKKLDIGYDYSFNDAYAKIMYGRDKQTLKKANNYGVSKTLYQSYGLSFRTILTAALNWEHIAKQSTGDDNALSWTAQLSPDVSMGGSDQITSTKKTPRANHEEVNTLFAVDKLGQKIAGSEVKPSENRAAINKTDVVASYKSAKFDILKTAMATLIAEMKADIELDLGNNFTLDWEIVNTEVLDGKVKDVYKNIVATLKLLAPEVNPIFKELKTSNEISTYFKGFQNYYRRSGIENDFDGVGSWLDKQSHDTGLSPWALFKIYSEKDASDSNNPFPEFTKMAKELKRQAESGEFKLPDAGKFSLWDNFLSELESQIYLNKILSEDKAVIKTTGIGGMAYVWNPSKKEFTTDNIIEYAKFGKKYQESKTNAELAQLIKEFNILKGISLNTDPKIFGNDKVEIVFFQKGLDVPLSRASIVYANDIKIQDNK